MKMSMKTKKFNHRFICLAAVFSLLFQLLSYTQSFGVPDMSTVEPQRISIKSMEDFINFRDNCSLDSYSKDKIFTLESDIIINPESFSPIPIFSGTFDGNGHTIKSLKITGEGSNQGLFRYINSGATVKNLNVEGIVYPKGTMRNIGGIVGSNSGTLLNCTFTGILEGKESTGGISGINHSSGFISGCTFNGGINGENYTGGISGTNNGIIIGCINEGSVNTSNTETHPNINNLNLKHITSREQVIKHTDSGGICGFSDGIIQNSINKGKVGYNHVGYNIGGIAGRQSGFISGCSNEGEILGRKDVGGIIGQMEPYLQIKFSEDTLEKLSTEVSSLKTLVDKALDDTENASIETTARLTSLNQLTTRASDELDSLLVKTTDYVDETVDSVNEISYRFSLFLDKSEPALESITFATEDISSGISFITKGFKSLESSSNNVSLGFNDLQAAFADMSSAFLHLTIAMEKLESANKLLHENLGDEKKFKEAKKLLEDGLNSLEAASSNLERAVNAVATLLESFESPLTADWKKLAEELRSSFSDFSSNMRDGISNSRKGLTLLSEIVSDDIKTINSALELVESSFELMRISSWYFISFSTRTKEAFSDFENASQNLGEGMNNFAQASEFFHSASVHASRASKTLETALAENNAMDTITFPKLGDKTYKEKDALFKTLKEITTELDALNSESSTSRSSIITDLRNINAKISDIFNVVIDARKKALDGVDLYEDISLEDTESLLNETYVPIKGHVSLSSNKGDISGDINVGGIAGSMAVEYDFDPEGDLITDKKTSLNFKYQTRTVLFSSTNYGNVVSKKDYVGGITGRMDLGLLTHCENYGSIESLNGDYVGGISGSSSSTIVNGYVKCLLKGRNFVGGITGSGNDVSNCYSLVKIENALENVGSISGEALGNFNDNYFVRDKYHGIDDISYSEQAVPINFDDFRELPNIPTEFNKFQLTFKADGNLVKTIDFNYMDSIATSSLPAVPDKDGFFGRWSTYDFDDLVFSETIEAVYKPLITTISSSEDFASINSFEKPLLLVEGSFLPESELVYRDFDMSLPTLKETESFELSLSFSIKNDLMNGRVPYIIRYYYPSENKGNKLLIWGDDKWLNTSFKRDGSYIVFQSLDSDISFCVLHESKNHTLLYTGGITLILVIVISIVIVRRKKSKRKRLEF